MATVITGRRWLPYDHLLYLDEKLCAVERGEITRLMIQMPPQHGKALADDTPILAARGWTTHGSLTPGDYVYAPDGKPVRVLAVTNQFTDDTFRVCFSDGNEVTAGGRHEWVIDVDSDCRCRGPRGHRHQRRVETSEMLNGYHRRAPSIGVRFITSVDRVERVPLRCIQVEGGMYCVGRAMIPTSNSELASHYFPAWWTMKRREQRCILTSYEARFAAQWGRKARDVVEEWGPELFGVSVRQDSHAAEWWDLAGAQGGMATAGVGGPITGKGAHLFVVDDPVKNDEEAMSEVMREKTWQWWIATALSRVRQGGAIVIIMTRWHEDDLVGRVLKQATTTGTPWEVVRLPAIAEEPEVWGRAGGRARGEPLCPQLFSLGTLEGKRRDTSGFWWAANFQQRPAPLEGGIFKRSWLRYYHTRDRKVELEPGLALDPFEHVRFITVDVAASLKTHADYTVIAAWCVYDRKLIMLDMIRERLEGPAQLRATKAMCERWKCPAWVEPIAYQLTFVQHGREMGIPVREIDKEDTDKDKVSRALNVTPIMEGGRFYLPAMASWLADYERELLTFPNGEHDDIVDVTAYAGSLARRIGVIRPRPIPATKIRPHVPRELEDLGDGVMPE